MCCDGERLRCALWGESSRGRGGGAHCTGEGPLRGDALFCVCELGAGPAWGMEPRCSGDRDRDREYDGRMDELRRQAPADLRPTAPRPRAFASALCGDGFGAFAPPRLWPLPSGETWEEERRWGGDA